MRPRGEKDGKDFTREELELGRNLLGTVRRWEAKSSVCCGIGICG